MLSAPRRGLYSPHLFHGCGKQTEQSVVLWSIKLLETELEGAKVHAGAKCPEESVPKGKK
jgi:hypothetical protein